MRIALLMLFSSIAFAQSTVTAVTNTLGEMVNVTILTPPVTARYSHCSNLTPYTYVWHVNDKVNISVNANNSAYTLNDLSTAALAVCIVKTVL